MTHASVVPALASTVVLVRSRPHGLEALLTKRPASMAFAPNMHVFPGGRVDDAVLPSQVRDDLAGRRIDVLRTRIGASCTCNTRYTGASVTA